MAQGPQLSLVPEPEKRCSHCDQVIRDYEALQKINNQMGALLDSYRREAEQLRHRNYDEIRLPQAA